MCLLRSNGISTGFSFEVFCALLFCITQIYAEFFDNSVFCRTFAPSRKFLIEVVLELLFSGQQRLRHIRGETSVPRIIAFGPAAPSTYSRRDFGPSNYRFRASSAFDIFEARLRSLELLLSGQQRLRHIRGETSVPRIIIFGPSAPSTYSR
jgi:hypothetical protein